MFQIYILYTNELYMMHISFFKKDVVIVELINEVHVPVLLDQNVHNLFLKVFCV